MERLERLEPSRFDRTLNRRQAWNGWNQRLLSHPCYEEPMSKIKLTLIGFGLKDTGST
jgi:hypothetical protein